MSKNVVIVGGRSKSRQLATSLLGQGYQVTAINASMEDCRKLAAVDGLTVIVGDGTKPYILSEAGVQDAAIIIALTPLDEDNLVACQLAKKRFNVQKAVALVSDPDKTDFFRRMGVDHPVCAVSLVTKIIEQQAFIEEISGIVLGDGRVRITETAIANESPLARRKLMEVKLPQGVIIGCILRGDRAIIPRGDTRLLPGDQIVVLSTDESENEALAMIRGKVAE